MTGRIVLSPRAKRDLEKIWDDSEKAWGSVQAESYTRQFLQNMQVVAAKPTIGRPCPEVRPGYYKYRSGSHFLFYRLIERGIDVVRILHERMDFGRYF